MTWYREWFGEEYLELYAHRDEEEARQQVRFFRAQCGMLKGPVLDLACGKGRHVSELLAAGYRVVGCDLPAHGDPRARAGAGRAGRGGRDPGPDQDCAWLGIAGGDPVPEDPAGSC